MRRRTILYVHRRTVAALERHDFRPVAIAGNHVVFRWQNGRRVRLRLAARAFPGLAGSLGG
jgi:hypothetical protein